MPVEQRQKLRQYRNYFLNYKFLTSSITRANAVILRFIPYGEMPVLRILLTVYKYNAKSA